MSCKTTPSGPNSSTRATPTKPRAEEVVLMIFGLTEFHVIATTYAYSINHVFRSGGMGKADFSE